MRTRSTWTNGEITSNDHSMYYYIGDSIGHPFMKTVWDPALWQWVDKPDPRTSFHLSLPRLASFEVASDLPASSTRSSWNAFDHYKRSITYTKPNGIGIPVSYYTSNDFYVPVHGLLPADLYRSSEFGPIDDPSAGLPITYADCNGLGSPDPPNLETMVNRGFRAMLPGIKDELSLINSVIELKDLKTLPRTISNIESVVGDVGMKILMLARGQKKTLQKVMHAGAEGYLESQFDLLPLLSDVVGVHNALRNTRRKIAELLRQEGKVLTRHFYVDLSSSYPSRYDLGSSNTPNFLALSGYPDASHGADADAKGSQRPYRIVMTDRALFHMEIQYCYYFSQYERANAELLGLLDALGVNINPKIIWNAIPWSFVVDWVLGVSRWLDQFKAANLDPLVIIGKSVWSIKVNRRIDIGIKYSSQCYGRPDTTFQCAYIDESFYKRRPVQFGASDIEASGFSLKEFSLASALGIASKKLH